MTAIIILLASFAQIGLSVFQTINVTENRRLWTAATSIVQSIAALTLYRFASRVSTADAVCAFMLGGILGGQLALHVAHKRRIA